MRAVAVAVDIPLAVAEALAAVEAVAATGQEPQDQQTAAAVAADRELAFLKTIIAALTAVLAKLLSVTPILMQQP